MNNEIMNARIGDIINSVYVQAVNLDNHLEQLENVPHIDMLDLALIARWKANEPTFNRFQDEIIDFDVIDTWGVTQKQLFDFLIGIEQKNRCVVLTPIEDMLRIDPGEQYRKSMYVLSNSNLLNGASILFYDTIFEKLYEYLGCDFYIIPASIDEVLVIKEDYIKDVEITREYIRSVNSEMSEDQILSYNLYHYNHETDTFSVC